MPTARLLEGESLCLTNRDPRIGPLACLGGNFFSSEGTGAVVAACNIGFQAAPAQAVGHSPRLQAAFELRTAAAKAQTGQDSPPQDTNGDEPRYRDRRSSFVKTLPHNSLGEVDPGAYSDFIAILTGGDATRFDRIPRSP